MNLDFENTVKLLSKHSGLSESQVSTYLKFIKAPDDFKHGQAAVIGFKRLFSVPTVEDLITPNLDELIITNSNLEFALLNSPDLAEFTIPANSSARTLGYGRLHSHPEYTVLFFDLQQHRELIEQMKQLVWVEHAQATQKDMSDYCLFLRVLTEGNIPQFIVDIFPKYAGVTAYDVYQILTEFIENETKSETQSNVIQANLLRNIQSALRYLKVIVGKKVIRRSHFGEAKIIESRHSLGVRGFASMGGQTFVRYLTIPDEDEPNEKGFVRSIDDLEIGEDELRELEAQGVEPGELENDKQIAWFLDITSPLYAQQFRAKVKIQGQVARISRHNQYLPLNTNLMNQVEANLLVEYLETCEVKTKNVAALILTLYIMLLTSSPFVRAKSFVLCFDNARIPNADDCIGYNFKSNVWIVPRLALPFATKEFTRLDALRPESQIILPVHTKRIQELIEKFFRTEQATSYPLSRMGFSAASVGSILKTVNDRLTPAKVSNYLILSLATTTSLSVAGYLFNRALHGSLARYYYSSHPEQAYQKNYNELVLSLLPKCKFNCDTYDAPEIPLADPKAGFGARYVPHLESIKGTLEFMSGVLSGSWIRTKRLAFIEFHNWYTCYCIYAQSLLTGIRAVVDPFISSQQIINSTGLAIFRDKDSDDRFHTRILPLHPLAIEITLEYERHRQVILEKMLLLNPLFCQSEILKKNSTFLIQPETFNVIETRPKHIKKILELFNDLPINSNRKYLRSFLEREGAIPEVIDATLGHASLGEPIGDSMSTFSFVDLRNQLFPLLDKLIEETGLKLNKGLTA